VCTEIGLLEREQKSFLEEIGLLGGASLEKHHSRRRSDCKFLDLQSCPVFLDTLLSDGDSVYSRKTLLEILRTP